MDFRPKLDRSLIEEMLSKRPNLRDFFEALQGHIEAFASIADEPFKVSAPSTLLSAGGTTADAIRAQLLFFHRILALRTAALLREAVVGLNESRLLAYALAVRGVLETAAVAAYHAPHLVVPAGGKIQTAEYGAHLREAAIGSRFNWLEMFTDHDARMALIDKYDAEKDWKNLWPEVAAANILTMLEALARRLKPTMPKARGIVFHDYSLLSDICHPSAGGILPFLQSTQPEMSAGLVPPRETVFAMAEMTLPCLGYSAGVIGGVLGEIEGMAERLRNSKVQGPDPRARAGPA